MLKKIMVLTVLLLCLTLRAQAQMTLDKAPSDTLVFISWRGVATLGPAYEQSNLQGLLEACKARQQIADLLTQLTQKAAANDPKAPEGIAFLRDLTAQFWLHPTALYFGGMDMTDPDHPLPKLALFCQTGPEGPVLAAKLTLAFADRKGKDKDVPAVAKMVGDTLFVGLGQFAGIEALLTHQPGTKTLSDDPEFAKLTAQVQPVGTAAVVVYVNAEGILQAIEDNITERGNEQVKNWFPKVIDVAGVGAIKRALVTGSFEGKNWATQGFVQLDRRRTGVAGFLDNKPHSPDVWAAIPAGVSWATVGRFDAPRLLAGLREGAAQIDPNGPATLDKVLQQGGMAVGFDIEKDLVNSLGDEWIAYGTAQLVDPTRDAADPARRMAIVNKLRDPVGATKALENLESFANGMIALRLPMAEAQKYQMKATTVNGIAIHSLALPKLTPSWAIKDGYLVIALSPQGVESALVAATQKAPAGAGAGGVDPTYAELAKQLRTPAPSSFSYVNLTKTAPEAYQVLNQLRALLVTQAAEAGGDTIKVPTLPTLEQIQPFVSPALKVFWSDDAGFHFKGTEPFPGSIGLLGPGMAGNGLLLATLTPALQKARENAKSVASASNLRQVGIGLITYALDHDNVLPPDLGSIFPYVKSPRVFVHPDIKVPAEIAKGTEAEQAAWLKTNSSYAYLHAGEKLNGFANPSATILAHEKLDLPGKHEKINVLYVDGHVESMLRADLEKALAAKKEAPAPTPEK